MAKTTRLERATQIAELIDREEIGWKSLWEEVLSADWTDPAREAIQWAKELAEKRLQLARDVAAGRLQACRFAASIDRDLSYAISGCRLSASVDVYSEDARADFLDHGAIRSEGVIYLRVPVVEEIEAEVCDE